MKFTKQMFFVTLLMSAFTTASAADFTEGKISYNILSESEKTVTVVAGAQKYSGAIVIPEKVTNNGTEYTVTAIGDRAFSECVSLSSVSFPSTLTSVGSYAFDMCAALSTLEFPANITTIGEYAFQGCRNLSTLVLPEKLTAISNGMFVGCEALERLAVPATVTRIGEWAFNCSPVVSIELPDAVKTIGTGAFAECGYMTSINLGKGVETISDNAFLKCYELTSIDLPASVKSIGENVFTDCDKLAAINVEEGNTIMASYQGAIFTPDLKTLRFGPPAIKEVVVPDECQYIAPFAFAKSKVERLTGCKNLLVVGESAFANSQQLSYVELGNKLTTIETYGFQDTAIEHITLPETLTSMGDRVFEHCGELVSIVIPDNVPEIGNYCFCNCYSLESVTWGKSVRSMGEYAFYHCPNLTTMICKPATPVKIYDDSYFEDDQYATIHVYVPAASLNAYKNANGWKLFSHISAMNEASITLDIVNIAEESAQVKVTPTDNETFWYVDVADKADFKGENAWNELVNAWKAEGDNWYETYCGKAHKGELTQTFSGLNEKSDYVAFAFAVNDKGEITMPQVSKEFTTLDSGVESVANDTDSVEVNGNVVTISGSYTAARAYTTDGRLASTFNGGSAELAPGLYIVRIQTAGHRKTVKVIVR